MITLIKINSLKGMTNPPLGLLYVGDALKKAGYEVKVLHYSSEDALNHVAEIVQSKPLFIGFSAFTAGGIKDTVLMCKEIKRVSNIPIVWGNAHASLTPEQCLRESYIDIVVFGEGEETTVELAKALERGEDLKNVKGIGYKDKGEIKFTEPRPFIQDLDKYKADWSLVDINNYIRPYWNLKRVLPIVTSRGCPHNCGFCYNLAFNKRKWRAHSIDFIVSEVKKLKSEYNLDGIRFWDDNFFVDKERAFEIAKRINLPYSGDARIDYVDENFARKLKETNCKELLFGVESGSNRILKLINKGFTVEDTLRAVRILTKFGIPKISASIIIGFPTETKSEFLQTMKLVTQLLEINPKMVVFTTGLYLTYPGVPLYELAVKEGFKPPEKTEEWENFDRWHYGFKADWLDWLTASEASKIRRYVDVAAILYSLNVPIFKSLAKYRLENGNFFMDYDLRLCKWLRSKYLYGDRNNIFIKFLRTIGGAVKKWRM